jgi:Tol biopolymer transport system component
MSLCSLCAIWLIACDSGAGTAHPVLSPVRNTASVSTSESAPSPIPSPTSTVAASATPQPLLQLTFVAELTSDVYGVYAVTLGCPDEVPPCLSEPELLFNNSQLWRASTMSWSPDGKMLAFDSWGEGEKQDIFLVDWNGDNLVNITKSPIHEDYPKWSPDGNRISYNSTTIETGQVFSVNPDGTDRVRLLSLADVNHPSYSSWSPDGKQLTFTGYDGAMHPAHVYAANLDGSSLVQLTHATLDSFTPGFSPDGSWITFSRYIPVPNSFGDITPNVFLIRPDGSGEVWLVRDKESSKNFPTWSPWGDWIAFRSFKPMEESDLFIIKPDGTNLVNVTNTPGINEYQPAWRVVTVP